MKKSRYFRASPFHLLVIAALLYSIGVLLFSSDKALPGFQIPELVAGTKETPEYVRTFICNSCSGPSVHSASIVRTADGKLISVWFGGSREGAGDVQIYSATKSAKEVAWSHEKPIINRENENKVLDRYLKKLGNPVLGRDGEGRLWLFHVTVSAGGWSGSSINYQISSDLGKTWSDAKRLVTSPFFNVSTLVHGVPLARSDGSLSLPVYHELAGKFSEMLRIGKDGRVLSKRRISHGRESFQPAVTALSDKAAVMIARSDGHASHHIYLSYTQDAGKTWSTPVATSLPNPDAGVAIATGPEKSLLVVYNDSTNGRGNLALAVSHDLGKTWKRIYYFEHEKVAHSGEEYSYPTLIRSGNQYHLVYTWRRKGIRYVNFNSAWVKQQEEGK
jgi:predicted neuraminidase